MGMVIARNEVADREGGCTRRSFLKESTLAVAAAGALGLAATAQAGAAEASDIAWDEEYDVVVIGAGAAGCAAAATVATEGNGVTCLLAEKGAFPRGNTPLSGGSSLWTNDVDACYAYLKELNGEHGGTPDDVLRVFAEGIGENYGWIVGLGANEAEIRLSKPGSKEAGETETAAASLKSEYPELEHSYSIGKFLVGKAENVEITGPRHLEDFLLQVVAEHPEAVTYRTEAAMTDLIQDPVTKRVVGAVINGQNIKARKGVVMACGGFEANPAMMQTFLGQGAAFPGGGLGNTGDGHKACMKLGADLWHMEHAAGFWMGGRDLANTMFTNMPIAKPSPKSNGITVGVNGRRFYMDWDGYNTNANYEYLGDLTCGVGSRHGHMQFGGEWPHLPMPSKAWFVFDAEGLANGAISASFSEDPVADGLCYEAQSLEELAELIGTPAGELEKTVELWNSYCEAGEDLSFHRPAETLAPVATPPFYAQLCVPTFLNTDGGPRRSARAEVLDVDGNPIPGLYSAGEFGSVWGGLYQGSGNIAECLTFGRIAVRNILAE